MNFNYLIDQEFDLHTVLKGDKNCTSLENTFTAPSIGELSDNFYRVLEKKKKSCPLTSLKIQATIQNMNEFFFLFKLFLKTRIG